jgi:hypothetical protein
MWNILSGMAQVFFGMAIVVIWIILAVFLLFVVWSVPAITINWYRERRNQRRPIICVCYVNGFANRMIGVALRRDYDKASKEYWKRYFSGKEHYDAGHIAAPDGRRIKIPNTFVFKASSPLFYTLVYGCYVERAEFDVPPVAPVGDERSNHSMTEAYRYITGREWDGHLINW